MRILIAVISGALACAGGFTRTWFLEGENFHLSLKVGPMAGGLILALGLVVAIIWPALEAERDPNRHNVRQNQSQSNLKATDSMK